MEWGNVGDLPYACVTNSEIMTRTKPDPDYYRELLERLGVEGSRCLMVGNDPVKDLPAKELGCLTYLVDLPPSHRGETRKALEESLDDPRLDGWGSYDDLQAWLRRSAAERGERSE